MTGVFVVAAIAIGIAFITIVGAAVAVVLVRVMPAPKSPAFESLRERYAKGEITDERYDEMRRRLAA
jgi:uncharacterized membrane protein